MKIIPTILALALATMPLVVFASATGATESQHAPAQASPAVQWKASPRCLSGGAYLVHIEVTAPAAGTLVAGWMLTASAFSMDGKPLAAHEDKGSLTLPEGAKISADVDLGPFIKTDKDFELAYSKGTGDDKPVKITLLTPAGSGLNFMDGKSVLAADLKNYNVLLQTNHGEMIVEFWPDVAPMHVRNFLDLSYTNFYSGVTFHRVMPGFMIQGGDPTGSGNGNGPRTLQAEFNDRSHERGVLSMARTEDPNSASCQFFIMHAPAPGLDHQYSAFGRLIAGYETLDAIATTPTTQDRPNDPQKILKATVIRAVVVPAK